MIANVVSGRVDAGADERVVRERLVPALQQQKGFQGGYWLKQADSNEVLAVTLWESEEALRAALATQPAREATAQTSAMFIGGPKMAVYQLVAKG